MNNFKDISSAGKILKEFQPKRGAKTMKFLDSIGNTAKAVFYLFFGIIIIVKAVYSLLPGNEEDNKSYRRR